MTFDFQKAGPQLAGAKGGNCPPPPPNQADNFFNAQIEEQGYVLTHFYQAEI